VSSASRANVVSSFTLIKGTMIPETHAVFAAWDLEKSKHENLDRLRRENYIGTRSATWLRDVAKVLNRRFEPDGRDLCTLWSWCLTARPGGKLVFEVGFPLLGSPDLKSARICLDVRGCL